MGGSPEGAPVQRQLCAWVCRCGQRACVCLCQPLSGEH